MMEKKRSSSSVKAGGGVQGMKKKLWRPEEDLILKKYVETHGEGNWATVSQRSGLMRGGKSCRLRWKNYLRPNIKRGHMSHEEQDLIIRMHKLLGNRWSLIAGRLPGRTDNEVKNFWNTHLNKSSSTTSPPGQPPKKLKTTTTHHLHYSNHDHQDADHNNIMIMTKDDHHDQKNSKIGLQTLSTTTTTSHDDHDHEEPINIGMIRELEENDHDDQSSNNWLKMGDSTSTSTTISTDDQGFYWSSHDMILDDPELSLRVPTNNVATSFVFDDEPFISYMDSFLLFEAFGCSTTTSTSTSSVTAAAMQSVMPFACATDHDQLPLLGS